MFDASGLAQRFTLLELSAAVCADHMLRVVFRLRAPELWDLGRPNVVERLFDDQRTADFLDCDFVFLQLAGIFSPYAFIILYDTLTVIIPPTPHNFYNKMFQKKKIL